MCFVVFFFKQKTAYEVRISDWSSDVCSSDLSVADDGTVKVEKVVCAVDCGVAVNPDQVKAQMEGGIGYGLGAVLHNAVTLTDGRVDQSNFHDYPPLRLHEMPQVQVPRVASAQTPTRAGGPRRPHTAHAGGTPRPLRT